MPAHIKEEYEKLSAAQKAMFQKLVEWSGFSPSPGVFIVTDHSYENILRMAKNSPAEG